MVICSLNRVLFSFNLINKWLCKNLWPFDIIARYSFHKVSVSFLNLSRLKKAFLVCRNFFRGYSSPIQGIRTIFERFLAFYKSHHNSKHVKPGFTTTSRNQSILGPEVIYSRVPIGRGVLNKCSGLPLCLCHVLNKSSASQDRKCIGWNISHNCHFE